MHSWWNYFEFSVLQLVKVQPALRHHQAWVLTARYSRAGSGETKPIHLPVCSGAYCDLAEFAGRMITLRHQPGTRSPSLCLGEWTILLSWPWGCAGFQGGKGMEPLPREDPQRCSLNGFSWQPCKFYSAWPLPIGKVFPVLWGYLFRCKQLITKRE